ncbi:muscle M-line assembly protein unc-89-like [Bolinopsis microptera]|uniref:muscle M-line assembly protein unc-89-like n=1 Tax=Bolinopsis microptera TaxID=2820187 RepID=UPI00307AFD8C
MRPGNQLCKESAHEKHKKHKKSKHKESTLIVRNHRGKSPRIKENYAHKKSVKDKSSKLDFESKKLTEKSPKNSPQCNRDRILSSCSDHSESETKVEKSTKRLPSFPPIEKSSLKKLIVKPRRGDQTVDDRNLSSRAAEIRKEIEELEHSVGKKKSKKVHDTTTPQGKTLEVSPAEGKIKKHKKKRYHDDGEEEPLIEDSAQKNIRHKSVEKPKHKGLESASSVKKHSKSEKEDHLEDIETKKKKFNRDKKPEKSNEESFEKHPNSRGSDDKLKRKKASSKNLSVSEDINDEAEKLRELAKRSMRKKSSKQPVSEPERLESSEEISPEKLSKTAKIVETKNGYKRLKFRKEKSPKVDKTPSPKKKISLSPKRQKLPPPEQQRSTSSKRQKSPTPEIRTVSDVSIRNRSKRQKSLTPEIRTVSDVSIRNRSKRQKSLTPEIRTVSDVSIRKALGDIIDPMDDFPASISDNDSVSEGEIPSTKERKSHKKSKKTKKKKEKKKRKDKKSSKSRDERKPEFSLEVSDNFGLCDSVLAFDEIGDIE